MLDDTHILEVIDIAFLSAVKPEHFTDYKHCEECAEHDTTLRLHDRATLKLENIGNPGWDPMCFASPEGKAYYFPALARFALTAPTYEYGWYGDQLFLHLTSKGQHNEFLAYCSLEQRRSVALFLAHVVRTRVSAPEVLSSKDKLLQAHELWSTYHRSENTTA
jgi:hypothetical protein